MTRLAHHATATDGAHPLAIAALDDALRAADPAVLVVAPRIVRRVIKHDAGIVTIGLRVPHPKTYTIDRETLLEIVDLDELDLPADARIPEQVILIARPTSEMLAELSPQDAVVKYWRRLFHARVHVELEQRMAEGRLDEQLVRSRIQQIGATEFEEIRSVLREEHFLLPPRSDRSVYVEFVAVYLELRYFVPSFLRSYFPSLEDFHRIDELLHRDVNGEALLTATRPAGAPDPIILSEVPNAERVIERLEEAPPVLQPARTPARKRSNRLALLLAARADRSARLGNQVRSAITRIRAARMAKSELSLTLREQARADIAQLVERLQAALSFTNNEADEWVKSLNTLLDASAPGVWTSGARALYDLQKVCVDHERGVYTLDVFGWAFSLGRKPLKRFLPGQRDVLMSKHLRGAFRRLPSVRLTHRARSRLSALLQSAVHRAEATLRARFKPVVERALDKVKLLPVNPPERVARKKLVDEILDRVVERGFLSMGDLRDALSRNNLKLPDLSSARQFFAGDQLLRADGLMAESLDGVYRGGEVYLRFPQRLSSLAFGTPLGRFLTRYVVLPFGGAFLILEGLTHLVTPIVHAFGAPEEVRFMNPLSLVVWGLFLLGLIHYRQYREQFVETLAEAGRLAKRLFVDVPMWLVNRPLVQWIVGSRPFRLFRRYVLKPLVLTALVAAPVALFDGGIAPRSVLITFAVTLVALNTRIGRNVDELVTDWAVSTWHRIRIHVFATLFRFIMDLFSRLLEAIERFLYTVDEWLRFRAGERTVSTVLKAALGSVWFFVNYVIRFCVTLMVEPQVNPIKHFPVVTVSHKLLLGMILAIHQSLVAPLGNGWAWVIAVFLQLLFPGMFGFLVWELKENWRLYAANRPPNLRPVPIGHHGETMIQFLHPGFRSGTLPKIYAKLRKASRKAYWTQNWKACGKHLSALHQASESIRRFVDRELLEVLHESRTWADQSITTGEIRLGCNRIVIELYCPDLSQDGMYLAFSDASGWLVASIHKRGWSDHLSYPKRHALASALAGFYKMAGVDLVREQIEANLAAGSPGYEINDRALVVWPAAHVPKLAYRLRDWPTLNDGADDEQFAPDRDRWVFSATDISWRRWVVTWELDQLDGISQHAVLENTALLPR
ncbi:MAG: hypothetical protein DWQ37_18870 [Planctomycetota bacterium]|nr:MAG: hypothetical protein DWQ37_18870 [Planctomycetota bacterium]